MYRFLRRYRWLRRVWQPGETAELTQADARWINADEPGTVEAIPSETEMRQVEAAPVDRMARQRTTR